MLVVRAASVLTTSAFQERLAARLPHDLLVVLGSSDDAPLDTFPTVVSLSSGPHHASLPLDWTADGFHPALAAEFGLRVPPDE